jgi:hypothetical protein
VLRILIPLAGLLIVALVVARALRRNRPGHTPAAGRPGRSKAAKASARAARLAVLWRGVGVLAGAVVAARLAYAPPAWLGLGLAFAAPMFALFVLAGVLAGEAVRYGRSGRAQSVPRWDRSVLPGAETRWVAGLTGALVVLLTVTTAVGSPDESGRAGRSLSVACSTDAGFTLASGPWPGSYYSIPMAVAVAAGMLATAAVLHRVARRPASGSELSAAVELRRRSARTVMAAAGLLVAVILTGTAYLAGAALVGIGCETGWYGPAGWVVRVHDSAAGSGPPRRPGVRLCR